LGGLDAPRRGREAAPRLPRDGTSLEPIQKHDGDARVDAEHLDETLGELATRNPAGTSAVSR
jgi:hypothetical protein